MGQAVRAADRLQGHAKYARLLRRDGHADAPGRRLAVRHGLRLRRRQPAPDPRRRRAAGERRAVPGLEELHPAAAVAAAQHGRRQALRRLAAVGPEHAALQHEDGDAAPTSWSTIYDPQYKGKVTVPDNPIQIADAALYLSKNETRAWASQTRTSSPKTQLDAAVDLLKKQRPLIKKYWALASDEIDLFKNGDAVDRRLLALPDDHAAGQRARRSKDLIPSEGATGWADTWMLSAHAETPELRLRVDEAGSRRRKCRPSRRSPSARRRRTRRRARTWTESRRLVREVPRERARRRTSTRIKFWKTPTRDCGNGSRTARTTRPGSRSGRRSRGRRSAHVAASSAPERRGGRTGSPVRPPARVRGAVPPAWLRATLLLGAPGGVVRADLPRGAGRSCSSRRSGASTRSPATSSTTGPRQLQDDRRDRRRTARSRCARSGSRRR